MSQNSVSEMDIRLWKQFVEAQHKFIAARMELFKTSKSLVELIRTGLNDPSGRTAAIDAASLLKPEQLQQLFDELLELSSFLQGQTESAQRLILSLPHEWLLANIEASAEHILKNGTSEEYRLLLTLYSQLDRALAVRLAKRASENSDPDVKEVGEDYLHH